MVKKVTNEDIVMLLSEGVVKEQIQDFLPEKFADATVSLSLPGILL